MGYSTVWWETGDEIRCVCGTVLFIYNQSLVSICAGQIWSSSSFSDLNPFPGSWKPIYEAFSQNRMSRPCLCFVVLPLLVLLASWTFHPSIRHIRLWKIIVQKLMFLCRYLFWVMMYTLEATGQCGVAAPLCIQSACLWVSVRLDGKWKLAPWCRIETGRPKSVFMLLLTEALAREAFIRKKKTGLISLRDHCCSQDCRTERRCLR